MADWKPMMASSIALAIGLSGCGEGSTGIASTPPPPTATPPTPTPTSSPGAASIGAPTLPKAPNGNLFPLATAGGPTIQAHPTTLFPLLETVTKINSTEGGADTVTTDGGATLKFSSAPEDYEINIGNPALGISNQPLTLDWCGYCAAAGTGHVYVDIVDPATSNLSWTTYGTWGVHVDFGAASSTSAAFVTGYKTPTGSVPTTGSATYNGAVVGQVMHPAAGAENGLGSAGLSGNASFLANFASGDIAGSLTNMMAGSLAWNSVSLQGAISGGQFTGTSAATSTPGNSLSLSGSATGIFAGMFFGPSAQELGAVWTLSDGTGAAIGSIGARVNTCNADCWAY